MNLAQAKVRQLVLQMESMIPSDSSKSLEDLKARLAMKNRDNIRLVVVVRDNKGVDEDPYEVVAVCPIAVTDGDAQKKETVKKMRL